VPQFLQKKADFVLAMIWLKILWFHLKTKETPCY